MAKVLRLQLQHWPFQWIFSVDFLKNWLVWSPFCPRDSQQSSPTPQFTSISSSALSFLYSPTLTSIRGYWKNHSFEYMDLGWQSDVCFWICCLDLSWLFFQGACLLILWLQSLSAVILENKICHGFHFFPQLFVMKWWDRMPWSWFFECCILSHPPLSLSSRGSLVLLRFLP